jgi:NADH-quinone oxidoreductase subunit L
MYVSALVALAGMGLAWVRYGSAPTADPDRAALNGLFELWHGRYYLDELYETALVRPLRRAGRAFFATDNYFIDGLIWFVTAIPRAGGAALGLLQRGALQGYALGMLIGLAILILVWQLVRPVPVG